MLNCKRFESHRGKRAFNARVAFTLNHFFNGYHLRVATSTCRERNQNELFSLKWTPLKVQTRSRGELKGGCARVAGDNAYQWYLKQLLHIRLTRPVPKVRRMCSKRVL
ncbi:hypothetical protein EVAR_4319_1 [Eumeta japonica]|uniref:Uncharacterized protein n=1 Tax=Eumeta variegata TaxID=151549 RepID=A0A4C1VEV5_EUMVA|nr:hypothetical protein EVAR_4319_1 [Eumeta japonica]